jgi:RNA polymerase sigma-70 factor (sigma-E family)
MGEDDADDAAAPGTADLAFGEFFVWQYRRLRRLGFLLTGDWDQGEELAQDALVRTYRAWRRVRADDHPEHYARKVLLNRHRSLLRRALVEARHAARFGTEAARAEEATGADELGLWAALRALPRRQQAVLVLRFREDLSEAEVARILNLPLGTVKSTTRRALARLRAALGEAAPNHAERNA